jgi:hypothetical protein
VKLDKCTIHKCKHKSKMQIITLYATYAFSVWSMRLRYWVIEIGSGGCVWDWKLGFTAYIRMSIWEIKCKMAGLGCWAKIMPVFSGVLGAPVSEKRNPRPHLILFGSDIGVKDRKRRPEGGWMRANQNFSHELGLYPRINSMSLSSNSAKTVQL